jgi:hypothetical protein
MSWKPPVSRLRDGGFLRFNKAALFAAILAVVVSLAGTIQASPLKFAYGFNVVRWNDKSVATGVDAYSNLNMGHSMLVSWDLNNDISMGLYSEEEWDPYNPGAGTGPWQTIVNAIQITKGVVKFVSVGVNIGQMMPAAYPYQTVVDVFGAVDLLAGSGGKLNTSIKATVGARFSNLYHDANGATMGLAISVGF